MKEEIQYCPECGEQLCENQWFYPGDGQIEEENETYLACSNCYYCEFEYEDQPFFNYYCKPLCEVHLID